MAFSTTEEFLGDIPRVGSLRERLLFFASKTGEGILFTGKEARELSDVLSWAARIVHDYEKSMR